MMKTSEPSARYLSAHTFLKTMILLVWFYGLGMVVAGRGFASPCFDALGFGPQRMSAEAVDYCIFMFGVLGAVILGCDSGLDYSHVLFTPIGDL